MTESGPAWRKAGRSNSQGGDCVELAALDTAVGVRDSKNPEAGHLEVRRSALAEFMSDVKAGRLDV